MTGVTAIEELSLEDLLNVTVTSVSKRAENLFEAPAMVGVLTEDDIRDRGYTSLAEVFDDLPGFDITHGDGIEFVTLHQRGYRSNNTDRTLLLIDGVEENDIWKGSMWLSRQYPLGDIKRIEVVYGPASTMYGANAFVGVVNVITKDPEELIKKGKNVGVSARAIAGSWQTYATEATIAAKKDDVSFSVTGRYFVSNEYNRGGFAQYQHNWSEDHYYNLFVAKQKDYKAKVDSGKEVTAVEQAYANLTEQELRDYAKRAKAYDDAVLGDFVVNGAKVGEYTDKTEDWLIRGKLKIGDFTLGAQTWRYDEGFLPWYVSKVYAGSENGSVWPIENSFIYAKYDKKLSDTLLFSSFMQYKSHVLDAEEARDVTFAGYANGLRGAELMIDTALEEAKRQSIWDTTWSYVVSKQLRAELKTVWDPFEKLNLVTSLEYRNGLVQGNYVEGRKVFPDETGTPKYATGGSHLNIIDVGGVAQGTYSPLDYLHLTYGARIDYNQIRSSGGYGTIFNQRVAVVATPEKNVIKAIFSTAFKDADNWTKYGTTKLRLLSNPILKPERVNNIEISAGREVVKNLFAELAGFQAWYSGAVGTGTATCPADLTCPDGQTTQNQAIGKLRIFGVQAGAKYRRRNYGAYANYYYVNPKRVNDDDTTTRIGDIANHHANAGVNARFIDNLNLNLRLNYVGDKPTGKE
ncbi:MAG: TonB-dependent receptor plug domain-containing protein, partial [Deltaproteobacteria bacterium]|nr:TonB-dependent receptor plug domain-containing protein [Deltaproteobacteria bacterium]